MSVLLRTQIGSPCDPEALRLTTMELVAAVAIRQPGMKRYAENPWLCADAKEQCSICVDEVHRDVQVTVVCTRQVDCCLHEAGRLLSARGR